MRYEPLKSGDEYDALTRGGKRVHCWRAGQRKAVKRRFNKRVRRLARPSLVPEAGVK
jgi:hypothetical protein